MSLHLITGYAGQAHITAADNASFNISMFGNGEFVFDRGNKFAAEIISNNLIRILDGDMMIQGRHVRLQENTYEELVIENGSQGMYRNDLIVARYSKDSTTGVEKCEFVVLKGEASAIASVDPEYTTGDITEQGNDLVTEFPLYRIKLNGLNIESVVRLFDIEKTLQAYKDETVAYIKSTVGYCNKNIFKYITDGFEYNGIVAQKNSDGSMTVSGTATDNVDYQIGVDTYPENEQYILSGYTEGADADCNIYAAYWEDASTWKSAEAVLDDKGVLITKAKGNICKVCLYVAKGKTVNITFYPMVRYASVDDGTFEQHVDDANTRLVALEQCEFITIEQALGTTSNHKPWLELKNIFDSLENYKAYQGIIKAGTRFQFIGYRYTSTCGWFQVFNHEYKITVSIYNGVWKYTSENIWSNATTFNN